MNYFSIMLVVSFCATIVIGENGVIDAIKFDPDPRNSVDILQANVWIQVIIRCISTIKNVEQIYVESMSVNFIHRDDIILGYREITSALGRPANYKNGDKIWCNINVDIPKNFDIDNNIVRLPKFGPRIEQRMHLRRN